MSSNKFHTRIVDWVLGVDEKPSPDPDRLRRNYLVDFILIVLPLIAFSLLIDMFKGFNVFSFTRLGIFVLVCTSLLLLKTGSYSAAIDVLFFGGTLSISLINPISYFAAWDLGDYQGLVPLVLFAAVALNGLYSGCKARVRALFILSLAYDVFYALMQRNLGLDSLYSHFGIMVLHVMAYGIGLFLIVYFDRLTRIAEARRIMNRRLEELMAESRSAGTARLESLSHNFRSPLTALMGVQSLLSKTDLDEDQRQYLELLEKSNRLLFDLVESILD
ncbi:hypothetical protein MASR2M78_21260 [Treponema sp.]